MDLEQTSKNISLNNSTFNATNNSPIAEDKWHFVFSNIIAYSSILLSIIGIVGNSFIIYKFGFIKRRRRSTYETLLLALGVVDLICVAITPLLFAYGTMTNFQSWHLGIVGCKFVLTILPMNVSITQGLLILISYERYKAVHRPFSTANAFRNKLAIWLVCCVLIAVILASPYAYALEIVDLPEYATKTCTTPPERTDIVLAFAAINLSRDLVTAIILATTGYLTTRILLRNTRSIALENNAGQFKDARKASLLRVRKMLLTMIIVFSLLTFPLDIFQFGLYITFRIKVLDTELYTIIRTLNTVFFMMQTSNSAANIFIYARMHKDFRNMSKKLCPAIALGGRKQSLNFPAYNLEMKTSQIELISFSKTDNTRKRS